MVEIGLPLLMLTGFFLVFGTVIWGTITRSWTRETWSMSLSQFMVYLKRGGMELRHMQMLILGVGALLVFYPLLISFMFTGKIISLASLGVLGFITARIIIAYHKA